VRLRSAQPHISASSSLQKPSPPFRGEREGPPKREGEVGGAANRFVGPPHPALSPRPAGERVNKRRLPDISLTNVRRDGPRIFPGQSHTRRGTCGTEAGIHTGAAVAFCDGERQWAVRTMSLRFFRLIALVWVVLPISLAFRRPRSLGQRVTLGAGRNARRAPGLYACGAPDTQSIYLRAVKKL